MLRNGASQCFHNDISNQLKLFEICCKVFFVFLFFVDVPLVGLFFSNLWLLYAEILASAAVVCKLYYFLNAQPFQTFRQVMLLYLFPPLPLLFWPSITVIKLHYRDTRCLHRSAFMCVYWGVDGGSEWRMGSHLHFTVVSTHTFILKLLQEKQTNKTSTVTLAALFASVCLLCYMYLSKVQVNFTGI